VTLRKGTKTREGSCAGPGSKGSQKNKNPIRGVLRHRVFAGNLKDGKSQIAGKKKTVKFKRALKTGRGNTQMGQMQNSGKTSKTGTSIPEKEKKGKPKKERLWRKRSVQAKAKKEQGGE